MYYLDLRCRDCGATFETFGRFGGWLKSSFLLALQLIGLLLKFGCLDVVAKLFDCNHNRVRVRMCSM